MRTKIGTSFGLALLLALGVIGAMLALGMFTAHKAEASFTDPSGGQATTITATITVTVDPSGAFHSMVPTDPLISASGSGYVPGTSITIHFTGANTDTVSGMTRCFYDPASESSVNVNVSDYAAIGDRSSIFTDVSGTKAAVTGWRMTTSTQQKTLGGQVGITPQLVPY